MAPEALSGPSNIDPGMCCFVNEEDRDCNCGTVRREQMLCDVTHSCVWDVHGKAGVQGLNDQHAHVPLHSAESMGLNLGNQFQGSFNGPKLVTRVERTS